MSLAASLSLPARMVSGNPSCGLMQSSADRDPQQPGSISKAACASLWQHFDKRYGGEKGDELPREPQLLAAFSELRLSRSQIARQWDRWRIARRDGASRKAHEHAASLHAHRRRAFGADDTLYNRLHSIIHDARFVEEVAVILKSQLHRGHI